MGREPFCLPGPATHSLKGRNSVSGRSTACVLNTRKWEPEVSSPGLRAGQGQEAETGRSPDGHSRRAVVGNPRRLGREKFEVPHLWGGARNPNKDCLVRNPTRALFSVVFISWRTTSPSVEPSEKPPVRGPPPPARHPHSRIFRPGLCFGRALSHWGLTLF